MSTNRNIPPKPLAVVIDDEFIIRELATSVLEDMNFETMGFTTADEAIGFIRQHHDAIKVVYTDIRMPGRLDGEALAREVAQRYPTVKVIISSGHVRLQEQDPRDGTIFMAKPWAPADLKRLLEGNNDD
ncbi:response regulator [Lacibacterium aquatile]|uniref:Response regulator n=1 Tax=Lacibacterium aquatile TaxID=1168082 RepID=A0ABW5DQW8_9PROT